MAFFTSVKAHVPILGGDESEEDGVSEATLRLVNSSSCLATPRLNEEDKEDGEEEEEEEEESNWSSLYCVTTQTMYS